MRQLFGREIDVQYLLSKFIPIRFTTTYKVRVNEFPGRRSELRRHIWWMWRDKIMGERILVLDWTRDG